MFTNQVLIRWYKVSFLQQIQEDVDNCARHAYKCIQMHTNYTLSGTLLSLTLYVFPKLKRPLNYMLTTAYNHAGPDPRIGGPNAHCQSQGQDGGASLEGVRTPRLHSTLAPVNLQRPAQLHECHLVEAEHQRCPKQRPDTAAQIAGLTEAISHCRYFRRLLLVNKLSVIVVRRISFV